MIFYAMLQHFEISISKITIIARSLGTIIKWSEF